MNQRAFRTALVTLALGLCACHAVIEDPTPAPTEQPTDEHASAPPTWKIAVDWGTSPALEFETWIQSAPETFSLTDADRAQLTTALRASSGHSLRAAVILGRSGTESETLLAQLERRISSTARADDASAVVSAAALGRAVDSSLPRTVTATRLTALSVGPGAHPDLEVRVHCAASALALGSEAVAPFLLSVLRIDTWEGRADKLDYEPSTTTAWPRATAAQALSAGRDLESRYRSDASIEERQAVARALAEHYEIKLPITL